MAKSAVDRAALLLGLRDSGDQYDSENPGVFAMSVRVPSPCASLLSAMSEQAGISRNEMINLVIEAGISAILEATSDDAKAAIYAESDSNLSDFLTY